MFSSTMSSTAFIADTMLGKLARWLSLLGYDIIYAGTIEDSDLVSRARERRRIILTRDTRLSEIARQHPLFLIKSTDVWEQLKEVIDIYPLDFSRTAFSRCQYCNMPIEKVPKSDVEHLLPPLVSQTQDTIFRCPSCRKLYWEASHVEHIKALLKKNLDIDI